MKQSRFLQFFSAATVILLMSIAGDQAFGVGILPCAAVLTTGSVLVSFLPQSSFSFLETIVPALTKESLLSELATLKTALETSLSDSSKAEIAVQIKEAKDAFDAQIAELGGKAPTKEELETIKADMAEIARKNQVTIEAFDLLQRRMSRIPAKSANQILSLKEAIGDVMGKMDPGMLKDLLNNKNASHSLPLGPVDLSIDWKEAEAEEKMQRKTDMVLSNTITGTTVLTYNQRQALVPAQKVNLRDLVPTTPSPTGQYVTYSETLGTNNIAAQVEGSSKANNTYAFVAATLTNPYIAGYSRFSKQLLKFTPFMQNALSRALMRDYFKAENAAGMTVLATGTGPVAMGTNPSDVLQLINLIGGFANTDYSPSYILVNWVMWSRLVAITFTAGYYAGAGLVVYSGNQLSIGGIPVIAASWVTTNKAVLIDSDYLERVEVEGLNLAFSYEDADNFTKNLITARVECQTAFNLMRLTAVCYADLGAS